MANPAGAAMASDASTGNAGFGPAGLGGAGFGGAGFGGAGVPEVPAAVPILSRGKHRNPRKGACFMELVSYLAGERWSDHPGCTHPLLSVLARNVNDLTSDEGRPRLAELIPSVIGLQSNDPHTDVRIALRCARTALPLVAEQRQRVMAVSVLACERVLDELDGRPPGVLEELSRDALDQAPHAEHWARHFSRRISTSPQGFVRHAAPNTVRSASDGIARAPLADVDAVLYGLLVGAIDDVLAAQGSPAVPVPAPDENAWAAVCDLTGVVR